MGILGPNNYGQARYSGELHNLQLTQAVFGTTAPIIFGTRRVAAKLLFYGGFYGVVAPNSGGKGLGGGKSNTNYDYYADLIGALASGSASGGCQGILNVWDQQGKLQNQSGSYVYTIPSGGGTVAPATGSAPIQMNLGVTKSAPYSVVANDYGSGGQRTISGTQSVAMEQTTGTPGAGQYTFDGTNYTFASADAGTQVTISYSAVFSLYYFEDTQAAEVPLASPYQVSTNHQQYFQKDNGVYRVDTGAALVEGTDYTESGGVYTFSSSLAGVYVYIKYTYYSSDTSITNTTKLNVTFFGGTLGQSPWSYMQSKYASSAFGYTGICYVGANPMALGSSGVLPSYNYEVVGLEVFPGGGLDAHFCDAFRTLLDDAFLGVGFPSENIDAWTDCYAYWAAHGYLGSVTLDTQTSVSDALSRVIETGNVAAFFSGGMLKMVPYGDTTAVGNGYTYTPPTTPAATLTWDDLLAPGGSSGAGSSTSTDVLQVSQKAPQDCWNYVQAQWTNRENDYNLELINEQNDAFIDKYGQRIESPQNWDWITNSASASWALKHRLNRECYIRNTYKMSLPFTFSYLEPMDLLVLPTGENVRITQVDDGPGGVLAIEAEQWNYGTADVTVYPKQSPTSFQPTLSQALPGNTYPVIFETPALGSDPQANYLQIAVAGNQSAWGGCEIYVSSDNQTYVSLGKVKASGTTGILSAPLASGSDPDTTDTLSVDLSISGGSLVSATQAQADAFATLAAIVDASGAVELVSFETANLTGANRYNLTYLRRGVHGTAIAAHAIGAEFSFLGTAGVFQYDFPNQYIGVPLYFKFTSFNQAGNQEQSLSGVRAYTFTPSGTAYNVPAPGNLAIEDDSTTVQTLADGTTVPRLLVTWTAPDDSYVTSGGKIEVQYQFDTNAGVIEPVILSPTFNPVTNTYSSEWIDAGAVSGSATYKFINGISTGQYQNIGVRVRSVRSNGSFSLWNTVTNHPLSIAYPRWPVFGSGGNGPVLTYGSGGPYVFDLQPAQAGADVTSLNTAKDTSLVDGVPSTTINLASTGTQTNLVPDSDFVFGFTYWPTGYNRGYAVISNGAGASGGNAVTASGTGSPHNFNFYSKYIPVTAGVTYTISCYMDATNITSGQALHIDVISPGNTLFYVLSQPPGKKGRVSGTFTVPSGVSEVQVVLDADNATWPTNTNILWSNPQLEVGSVATAYKANLADFTSGYLLAGASQIDLSSSIHLNKTANYITYTAGGTVDSLKPAQAGADVTGANHALALKVQDHRTTNDLPSYYRGLGIGFYSEFKEQSVINGPDVSTYVMLYSEVSWTDTSGGPIVQWYTDGTSNNTYKRSGNGTDSAWNAWIRIQAGADVTSQNTAALTSSLSNHTLDNLSDGTNYTRVSASAFQTPNTQFVHSAMSQETQGAIDALSNLQLKNKFQGSYQGQHSLPSSLATLPANQGAGLVTPSSSGSTPTDLAVTFTSNGNMLLISCNVFVESATQGGQVSSIAYSGSASYVVSGSGAPPDFPSITITGDGTGATAQFTHSVVTSGRFDAVTGQYIITSTTYTINGINISNSGSGYTSATASFSVPSDWTNNSLTAGAVSLTTATSTTNQPFAFGFVVDGSLYTQPKIQYTDGNGIGNYTFTTLLSLNAASHTIELQGYTTSSDAVYVTQAGLNLVELG